MGLIVLPGGGMVKTVVNERRGRTTLVTRSDGGGRGGGLRRGWWWMMREKEGTDVLGLCSLRLALVAPLWRASVRRDALQARAGNLSRLSRRHVKRPKRH